MKQKLLSLSLLLTTMATLAQVPQGINYQAVMRGSDGTEINNQAVSMRLSILRGGAQLVYQETHSTFTTQQGLVNLTIGFGSPVQGDFSAIDWANGPYFVQMESDLSGGTNYLLFGSQQLMSVPYALYAEHAGNANGGGSQISYAAPTQFSSPSQNDVTYIGGLIYCRNLSESGHNDWHLPTLAELEYMLQEDAVTLPNLTQNARYWLSSTSVPPELLSGQFNPNEYKSYLNYSTALEVSGIRRASTVGVIYEGYRAVCIR